MEEKRVLIGLCFILLLAFLLYINLDVMIDDRNVVDRSELVDENFVKVKQSQSYVLKNNCMLLIFDEVNARYICSDDNYYEELRGNR